MTRHRPRSAPPAVLGVFLLGLPVVLACEPSLAVSESNRVPVAEARVLGQEGQTVVLDYMGSPLAVTLDGSASRDPDGAIKTYRWLSGTRIGGDPAAGSGGGSAGAPAAGSGGAGAADDAGTEPDPPAPVGRHRWVPNGEAADWPADEQKPVVMLGEGVFTFELWVIDEKNAVSEPSSLEVTVRTPLDPAAQACVDSVYDMVSPACKTCLCTASESCRMMASETVCNQTCWGLLNCIGTRCPTFRSGGPTDCLVAMCSSSLGGATGATAIGPCITQCASVCRSGS